MILDHRVTATPDRLGIVESETGRRLRFTELDRLAAGVAGRLATLAGSPAVALDGDDQPRLGTLCRATPAFSIAYYGARRAGWTVVGLDPRLNTEALEDRIRQADIDCIATDGAGTVPATFDGPMLTEFDRGEGSPPDEIDANRNRLADDTSPGQSRQPNPASEMTDEASPETALILFTSGTTGEPKGVRLTERNLRASAIASACRLGISPTGRWLCCLPVHHMGGFGPFYRTVFAGTTLVTQRAFDARETASVLSEFDITGISLVPTQLRRLLSVDAPLASLETVLVGGAPLPSQLARRALDANVPLYPTYGMTETTSQVATAPPAEVARYPGTVGQPLLSVAVEIIDDGDVVEPEHVGEIVVDGPTVTPGYLHPRPERFGPWGLHTGDMGYRDEEGRLWIVGRSDDLIQTGGELVAPSEVASVIHEHQAVAEAAIVGLADEEWGERIGALVVSDKELSVETIRQYCREHLPGYKVPKTIDVGDQLPRTDSGTVDRDAVCKQLRANADGSDRTG